MTESNKADSRTSQSGTRRAKGRPTYCRGVAPTNGGSLSRVRPLRHDRRCAGFPARAVIAGTGGEARPARFGRRLALPAGSLIFTLAGFGCTLAQILVARLFQGIGAGTEGIPLFVIVHDLFEGHVARIALPLYRTQRYAAD